MHKSYVLAGLLVSLYLAMICGCGDDKQDSSKTWSAEFVQTTEGFKIPECVVLDPKRNCLYVSNVDTDDKGYWVDDGKGFISQIDEKGQILKRKLLDSTAQNPVNAPKGMAVLGDHLYYNDNKRLMRYNLATATPPEEIRLPQTEKLNDMAADGKFVYATDNGLGIIYRIDPEGNHKTLKAPKSVNGVTCSNGNIFAVSWELHEIYEIDPAGITEPKPFGLASHFTNLDAIEVLPDGSFLVSDFMGNKVSVVSPDRKTVKTIAQLTTPADVGLNRDKTMLYIPQLTVNKVVVYKLTLK
jgi:DNA-binding beta-propeller fold protein YncE